MRSLTSGNLTFHTLPIVAYETIGGQDANQVDPILIQKLVQETFYPAPGTSSSPSPRPASTTAAAAETTVDVYNGGSTQGLAGQISAALVKDGYKAGQIGNTSALTTTEVLYGTGSAASASNIASLFGVAATASSTVTAGHVEVMLGANAALPGASATPTASSSTVPIPTAGAQGGAVTAKNGIPCVD
jgi:LytR cell envelope-related transcriptional attenuator